MPNHENTQRVTKNQIDLSITPASLRDPLGIGVTQLMKHSVYDDTILFSFLKTYDGIF